MTIKAAEKLGKSVSVCGEMAGDAKFTKLLIGMGLRQLSMHPSHVLKCKTTDSTQPIKPSEQ